MQLYNLLIPTHTNDHQRSMMAEHATFEHVLLKLAGGYTVAPDGSKGVWTDEAGKIVRDDLRSYIVAVTPQAIADILTAAHKLFTDQVAIYVSEVGTYGLSYTAGGRASVVAADLPMSDDATPGRTDMRDGWFDQLCRDSGVRRALPAGDVMGSFAPGDLPLNADGSEVDVLEAPRTAEENMDRAARYGEELRNLSRLYGDAAWKVDSAASMVRKALAGYRSSGVTGDTPWDVEETRRKLAATLETVERLL